MCYLRKMPLLSVAGVILAVVFIAPYSWSQEDTDKTRIDTNLVLIDVLVADKTGQAVRGLRADQFELFADNVRQPIESFSTGAAPISFGVVYDMHPTTADRTRAVIESLREYKRVLGTEDDIFLVAFDMRGQQTFDFVPTLEQLERHMAEPQRPQSRSLYDAIYFASDKIRSSRNQKRVLLIISDSSDHNSRHPFSDIQRKLASINTEVYAIIVDEYDQPGYKDLTRNGRDVFPFSTDASPRERAALLDLAIKSGGTTYLSSAKNAFQLQSTYTLIAGELRSHYTLGFYPDVVDDKRHSVRVRLRDVGGSNAFVLSYRMTYQVAGDRGAYEK